MNRKAILAAAVAAVLGLGMLYLYMQRFEAELVPVPNGQHRNLGEARVLQ